MAQFSMNNLPKNLLGNPIPMQTGARAYVGGRSVLDNIYGQSSNPSIQANPPSRNRSALMGNRGFMNGVSQPRNFSALNQSPAEKQAIINQSYIRNNLTVPKNNLVPSNRQPPIATANNTTAKAKPNFKNSLLNYLGSAEGKGMAQGLLEASAYSDMPVSFGQALAQGMARSNEAKSAADETAYKKQQDKFLNELKTKEENRTEKKFDKEMSILDQSILDNDEVKGILKNTKISDFDSDRDYYRSVGNELLKLGKVAEAKEFMALAAPKSITDLRKDIVSANKDEGKVFKDVKDAIVNYQGLQSALRGSDGSSAYATMIKFIKGLDNSVVREGEVRSFTNFQGLYNKLKIEIDKAQGLGFPPETKSSIANLSNETFTALIEDYQNYQEQKSNGIYGQLNMSPELIFSGYDTSYLNNDINQSFTADDFSTQQMYEDYGQLGDVKRKHNNKSDEELQEYLKTADPLEVKHLINLGFINQ